MIGSKSSVLLLLSLLLIVLVNAASRDFYSILDVPRDAPKSQIKRHFKKLSRTFHPDKNPGNEEAAQKFMEIANGTVLNVYIFFFFR